MMDPTQRWHIVWGLYNDAFNWRFKKNNRVCNRNIRFQVLIFWHTRVRYFTFKNTIFRLKILKRSSWQKKERKPLQFIYLLLRIKNWRLGYWEQNGMMLKITINKNHNFCSFAKKNKILVTYWQLKMYLICRTNES